jgi:hypothetical protein
MTKHFRKDHLRPAFALGFTLEVRCSQGKDLISLDAVTDHSEFERLVKSDIHDTYSITLMNSQGKIVRYRSGAQEVMDPSDRMTERDLPAAIVVDEINQWDEG